MKIRFSAVIVFALVVFSLLLSAVTDKALARSAYILSERSTKTSELPILFSYQGYVTVNNTPYNGVGYFKFAILDDAGMTRWSNDGASANGSEPVQSVQRDVTNGLFNIYLGNTNLPGMPQPISAEIFDGSQIFLRVWFSSDNLTFSQLTPDRGIAPVPFAFWAKKADDADLLDGLDSLAFALTSHNHNDLYAALNHAHEDLYAALTHEHNAAYVNDNANEVDNQDIASGALDPNRISGTAWTSINDGPGNGLDADLLDGNHASAFALIGHSHAEYALAVHEHDSAYVNDDSGEVDNADINTGALSPDRISGTAWTLTNDGSGSGLDADLLDGQESSYYQRRVSATCAAGSTIHAIAEDGSVTCEPHITRPRYTDVTAPSSAWFSGSDPSITIGLDGLPLIGFRHQSEGSMKLVHCNDLNCVSSTTRTLQSGNNTGFNTQMTLGSDGFPIITFVDDGFLTGNLYILHCQDALCDTFNTQTLGPAGAIRNGQSIAIGLDGLPIISYYDSTNQNLLVAHCADVACNDISTQTIDTAVGVTYSYTSIAIGIDGLPIISYYDPVNTSLEVAHCGNADCSSGVSLLTLDGSGPENSGYYNPIAIGADGLPIIVFTCASGSSQWLYTVHCGDLTCSSGNEKQTVFSGGVSWPSLTIGSDGLPIITFHDYDSYDLEITHCNNLVCSSITTFTPQPAGLNGGTSSITIGADGLPIIAYFEQSPDNQMNVLHCANALCTPNWSRR